MGSSVTKLLLKSYSYPRKKYKRPPHTFVWSYNSCYDLSLLLLWQDDIFPAISSWLRNWLEHLALVVRHKKHALLELLPGVALPWKSPVMLGVVLFA